MTYFLNINKQSGMTAHDVVNVVRKIVGVKQVGHAGTLDPAATGVLPIAVGKACRLLRYLSSDKVYVAEILLGTQTTTDDLEGEVIAKNEIMPDPERVIECLKAFVGPLEQKPPSYSAVHYKGKRLYELARQGTIPEDIALRKVTVYKLDVLQLVLPVVKVRISSSSGTYIRSIARDLGSALAVGGCLQSLIREEAGPFKLENAISLDRLKELVSSGHLGEAATDPLSVLALKSIPVDENLAKRLSLGQSISPAMLPNTADYDINKGSWQGDTDVLPEPLVLSYKGCKDSLLAICRVAMSDDLSDYLLKPEVVIAEST